MTLFTGFVLRAAVSGCVVAASVFLGSCERDTKATVDVSRDWNAELLEDAATGDVLGIAAALAHGADPNHVPDPLGLKSPLMNAVRGGHVAAVRLLLLRGALPNARTIYETPLHAAAARGQTEIVRLLTRFGANVNARVGVIATEDALAAAVLYGHADVVWMLYSEGGLVKPSYLCWAVRDANVAVVNVLMNAGLTGRTATCGDSSLLDVARHLSPPVRDEIIARLHSGGVPKSEKRP